MQFAVHDVAINLPSPAGLTNLSMLLTLPRCVVRKLPKTQIKFLIYSHYTKIIFNVYKFEYVFLPSSLMQTDAKI